MVNFCGKGVQSVTIFRVKGSADLSEAQCKIKLWLQGEGRRDFPQNIQCSQSLNICMSMHEVHQ